jgi:hypothetical protein
MVYSPLASAVPSAILLVKAMWGLAASFLQETKKNARKDNNAIVFMGLEFF